MACLRWHSSHLSLLPWYQSYSLCNPCASSLSSWLQLQPRLTCSTPSLPLSSQYISSRPLEEVEGLKWQREQQCRWVGGCLTEHEQWIAFLYCIWKTVQTGGSLWHLKNCIFSPESRSLHQNTDTQCCTNSQQLVFSKCVCHYTHHHFMSLFLQFGLVKSCSKHCALPSSQKDIQVNGESAWETVWYAHQLKLKLQ